MGRDTIQLENAVSTISQEYLLKFTSENGIPKSLHPELPGPEDPIVEFPEGKVDVYTKFFKFANFLGGKSLAAMGRGTGTNVSAPATQEVPVHANGVSDLDLLLYAKPRPAPEQDIAQQIFQESDMDLFSLISAPNPAKVTTGTRPRAAHEVSLLTATANLVIDMEDMTGASGSSGTPSTVEKSPLDFSNEDLPPLITETIRTEEQVRDELS
nr:hypothetical protein [Tanacetum cinerariifolium]